MVVRPKKFTLEERNAAIRTIIGADSVSHRGSLDKRSQDRTIVPATAVPEAWSEYLRENIPPQGWLAVWDLKNPEQCEVPVCVDVISMNFKDFEAKIQVVEAPNSFSNLLDDEIRTVPLANLTPIHYDDQDKTDEHVRAEAEGDVANVPCLSAAEETAIAVALDHFRFFFTYLWRSFDVCDEDTMDWVGERLDNRMALYAEHLDHGEAAKNWGKMVRLEIEFNELQNQLEEMNMTTSSSAEEQSESDVGAMLEIEAREMAIRREAVVVENPEFRNATRVARISKLTEARPEGLKKVVLVWDDTRCIALFRKVLDAIAEKLEGDDKSFSVAKDMSAAILECLAGDTVVLPIISTDSSSIYVADDLGELEEGGGTIIGVNVIGFHSGDATVALRSKCTNESAIILDGVNIKQI